MEQFVGLEAAGFLQPVRERRIAGLQHELLLVLLQVKANYSATVTYCCDIRKKVTMQVMSKSLQQLSPKQLQTPDSRLRAGIGKSGSTSTCFLNFADLRIIPLLVPIFDIKHW